MQTVSLTCRHPRLEDFGNRDSSFGLVDLQHGANDARHGAHGRIQHVAVLGLKIYQLFKFNLDKFQDTV